MQNNVKKISFLRADLFYKLVIGFNLTILNSIYVFYMEFEKKRTYSSQLHVGGNAILPGKAEDVRQIESEVDNAAAGSC